MPDFFGTAGDDSLAGGPGPDTFHLEDGGADTASGGGGSDVFMMGGALTKADRIDGGDGSDTVQFQGDYSGGLVLGAHTLTNVDLLSFLPWDTVYDVTLDDRTIAPGANLLVVVRDHARVWLDASAETDGVVTAYFSGPRCSFIGGAGNDTVSFSGGLGQGAAAHGGDGFDTMYLSGVTYVRFTDANFSGFEHILLSGVARLTLDDGADAAGQRLIVEVVNSDGTVVDGSREHDGWLAIWGGSGADTLIGGRGGDGILTKGGGDVVIGGRGADHLSLGDGEDTVVLTDWKDSPAGAADTISDLGAGDVIDLAAIDADARTPGDQAFTLVDAFTGAAGEAMLSFDPDENITTLLLETDGRVDSNGAVGPEMAVVLPGGDYTDFTGFVL